MPAFPGSRCDLIWPNSDIIDVVLFGDAAYALCFTQWWPRDKKFRLWVLNQKLKAGLQHIFHFQDDEIGVIPREELLKRKRTPFSFPLNSHVNLIYSARKTKSKNFELSCFVAYELQKLCFRHDLTFIIYSLNRTPEELAFRMPVNDWFKRPILAGDKGSNWADSAPARSVYINLSVDPLDDFSVSCAEAQEKGWPLILSERGPYLEVQKNSLILIPLELLKPKRKKVAMRKQARDIAEYIVSHWSQFISLHPDKKRTRRPIPISSEFLNRKERLTAKLKRDLKYYPIDETIWDKELYLITEGLREE
jgi:hypothetical protein